MTDHSEETSQNITNSLQEGSLDDDRHPRDTTFQAATLEISGDGVPKTPEAKSGTTDTIPEDVEVEFAGPGINRNRPGSTIGRQSVRSTTSRTSMKSNGFTSEKQTESFFSYKVCNCYFKIFCYHGLLILNFALFF